MEKGNITLYKNVDTYILGDNLKNEYLGQAAHNFRKKVDQIKSSLEEGRKVLVFVPEMEKVLGLERALNPDSELDIIGELKYSMLAWMAEYNQNPNLPVNLTVIATTSFDAKKIEGILTSYGLKT